MAKPPVTTDVHQAFDVHLYAFPQIALGLALSVDDRTDLVQLVLAEIADLRIDANGCFFEDRRRARFAYAVNVRQTDLCPFVGR